MTTWLRNSKIYTFCGDLHSHPPRKRARKISCSNAVKRGCAAALLILIGIGAYSYRCTRVLVRTGHEVAAKHAALGKLDDLPAQMPEAENSGRDFVVAGENHFLETLEAAIPKAIHTVREHETLFRDTPARQRQIQHLSKPASDKIDYVRFLVDQRKNGGYEAQTRGDS